MHGWHDCPLRLSHQRSDDTQHASAAQVGGTVGGNNVSLAWCTQEDIAFPAVMEIGSTTPLGNTAAVFVDRAASHHMVPAESWICQHVTNKIDCDVRVKGSCGLSSATSKGTLAFRAQNDRGELVPIHLEVLIVPDLGASVFSVGALQEKGVKLDLCLILRFYATVTPRFPFQRKFRGCSYSIYFWMGKRNHSSHAPRRWTRTRGNEG